MKVLHLLTTNSFSGAENVACQIIAMFKSNKNIEMIYCSPDGAINDALKERGVPFFPISVFNKKNVKTAIKQIKPDIIHAHDMRASFIASRVCKKIPIVSHIHNNNFDSRKISIKSFAYLYAIRKIKHIFWVSNSSFNGYAFHKLMKKKSSILYNIINIDELYEKVNKDDGIYDYDIIFLGRLTYPKNPLRLIEICKKVVNENNNIKIAIVGTGEMFDEIKELVNSEKLSSNIHFYGYVLNPTKILKNSKVMLMTSIYEGTPMCVLEAQALGVPVVSTPVDGLKDLIVNGENGFLSNDNNELVKYLLAIIEDKEFRSYLSNNQINSSKKWNDKSKYYNLINDVYMKCIAK